MNAGFWIFLGAICVVLVFQIVATASLNSGPAESRVMGDGIILMYGAFPIILCLIGMGVSALVHFY